MLRSIAVATLRFVAESYWAIASKVELPFALIRCTYPATTPVASAFAPNSPGTTVATVTAPVATEATSPPEEVSVPAVEPEAAEPEAIEPEAIEPEAIEPEAAEIEAPVSQADKPVKNGELFALD